jgi:serine protease Do
MAAILLVASTAWSQENRIDSQSTQTQGKVYLGAAVESTRTNAEHQGVIVQDVTANSPAEAAGLKKGDIITKVGKEQVRDADELAKLVGEHKVGDQLPLTLVRDGQEKSITVTLQQRPAGFGTENRQFGQRPGEFPREEPGQGRERDQGRLGRGQFQQGERGQLDRGNRPMARGAGAFFGVQSMPLTPDVRERQGFKANQEGLFITDVVPNSPADTAGVRRNDLIISVDGKNVTTIDDLRRIVASKKVGDELRVGIMRGNQQQDLTARLAENPTEFGGRQLQYGAEGMGFQNEQIQQLERRVRDLEQRIRELEKSSHRSNEGR